MAHRPPPRKQAAGAKQVSLAASDQFILRVERSECCLQLLLEVLEIFLVLNHSLAVQSN